MIGKRELLERRKSVKDIHELKAILHLKNVELLSL